MAGQDPSPIRSEHFFAGRYRLERVLGRGGAADVFRAEDQLLGRSVAVKIFRRSEHVPHEEQRIDAEMRTLASLSHPGLVTLFDAGLAPDSSGLDVRYLVMELVEGPTLGAFRNQRSLPLAVAARVGRELADSLSYIHSEGVIHRDIKPANVLITEGSDSLTKLTDFGIARVVDADRLTAHGSAVGTAHYLSPEQATGAVAGPASDVYSLGLVLIECLSGRMAFEGSATAAALARLHRDPEVPAEHGEGWASLLTSMTARRPLDRPSALEVSDRLRTLADAGSPAIGTAVLATNPSPVGLDEMDTVTVRRPVTRWALILGALGTIFIAALILWGITLSQGQSGEQTSPPAGSTASTAVPINPEVSITPPLDQIPSPTAPLVEAPAPVPTDPSAKEKAPRGAPGNNGNGNSNGNNGNGNGKGNN
ncbi:serine/threonine-protein kinase [Rhodococcus sp. G-MC3]|uniref:serine/threonine-protein kinase n=1 Tax=Rhodococcus sp. G-MC3 TaxID=3046209 RepID=UPI0024B907BB|nr:serine/threonine-protein kinase [Rhodococcus sp. G-MC3]MDJ0392918.1 serine/threonine-protein kinase [Rhodococcus sp. G-MC3]